MRPKRTVIFDFIRTLYDPVSAALYSGARAMLEDIAADRRLILYSRRDRSRAELLEEMGIDDLFESAYFVDQKNSENLAEILKKHDLKPEDCIVVGDMIASELAAAGELDIDTIWFKQQAFANILASLTYRPTHTVNSISDMHRLIKQLP